MGKIKSLFSDPFQRAQYDSALKALKMVFKDTQFLDAEIQTNSGDIDADLLEEIKFYKQEVARLQLEINS